MNKKGVGAVFCLIAAILMSAKYLCAAIFVSNAQSWDAEMFKNAMSYIGPVLPIAAIAALAFGVIFLIWGMFTDTKAEKKIEEK